jgi:hypothetical protein
VFLFRKYLVRIVARLQTVMYEVPRIFIVFPTVSSLYTQVIRVVETMLLNNPRINYHT